jgi:hypothetical protein
LYCLPLLLCERLGDQTGLPDALHEVGSTAALYLQDHRIIRVLSLPDYFDRPGREMEGVIAFRGLQSVD